MMMRKIILIHGLIAGTIVAGFMFASLPFWDNGTLTFDNGELVGYASMVLSLSVVFFGIKKCRDDILEGTITFWQAFKVGILITLIASVIYALAWEVAYHTFAADFTEKMSQHYLEKATREARSEEELKQTIEQTENFSQWYKNPLLRFGITLTEILPVGIIITLISAGLLRKKEVLPLDQP
jgi:hypothetical protein